MSRFIEGQLLFKRCVATIVMVGGLVLPSGCAPLAATPTPEQAKQFLKLRGYNFDEKAFLAAAAASESLAVNAFLAAGIDPNSADETTGETAMMAAATRGDLALVKILLQGGGDVNRRD